MPARANFPAPLPPSKFGYQGATANAVVTNTRFWHTCVDTDLNASPLRQDLTFIADQIQGASSERRVVHFSRLNPQAARPGRWRRNTSYYSGGNLNDAHNTSGICRHLDGRLLATWDCHDTPLLHRTARLSDGIVINGADALPLASGGASVEAQVTYQQHHKYANGNIILVYRSGVSGLGNTIIEHYNNGTGLWTLRQNPLIDGEGARSAYTGARLAFKTVGGVEYTYIAWNWREVDSNYTTNHDFMCMVSADECTTWKRLDGSAQTLPVTQGNQPLAQTQATNTGVWNMTGVMVDSAGRPYTLWFYGASPSQYHCVYWKGAFLGAGAWANSQVGTEVTGNSLVGVASPTGPFWASAPNALERSDNIHNLFWSDDRGDTGLWARTNTAAALQASSAAAWTTHKISNTNWKAMDSAANYDRSLWAAYGILDIYHQEANLVTLERCDITASL